MGELGVVTIARLGAGGDGVVETPEGPRFVAGALPGEQWLLSGAADDRQGTRLSASPLRREAVCRHFGHCGGCMAQHMAPTLYAEWKRQTIVDAFLHRGITADVRPLETIAEGTRRRAFLGVERKGNDVSVGFREEGRHTLVDMAECPVLAEEIVEALPALRAMARVAMADGVGGRLIVTCLDHGLDVSFDNGHKSLGPEARATLASLAAEARLVRLWVAGEPIVERARPVLTVSGVEVEVPPSLFLQAVPEAERRLVSLVEAALPAKSKRVADLFSGLGTFTFPLARRVRVSAFDSDKRAIAALERAVRHATGLKPVEARVRDLYREPLSPKELEDFDCVVFDPPRAGAAEQSVRLARSAVSVVIAVSCAPATLARDARTLIDAGFSMDQVTPIDQFLYSPHVELMTVFRRKRTR